MRIVVPHFFPQ